MLSWNLSRNAIGIGNEKAVQSYGLRWGWGGNCQGGKQMMALNYSCRLIGPNYMNWFLFVSFHKLHSFIFFCILFLSIISFSSLSAHKFISSVILHLGFISLLFHIKPFCPPFCFHLFHICCTHCFASVMLWSLLKTEIGQLDFYWQHSFIFT